MREEEYDVMFGLEDSYWWYRGFRKTISNMLSRYCGRTGGLVILDAGCGTGGNRMVLEGYGRVVGIDVSKKALRYYKLRGNADVLNASVKELPFREKTFDVVTSFDVINYFDVGDDHAALSEFHRVLKKGGLLLLNLPAFDFLKSEHDDAVYTKHRYTRGEIKNKLIKAGFEVKKSTYWNTLLLPAIAAIRLTKKRGSTPKSDLKQVYWPINSLLYYILLIESRLVKTLDMPLGLSVFCVARK